MNVFYGVSENDLRFRDINKLMDIVGSADIILRSKMHSAKIENEKKPSTFALHLLSFHSSGSDIHSSKNLDC